MLVEPVKRRFTVEEYHRMGEAGILHADDRVELIEGEITNLLVKAVGGRALEVVPRAGRLTPAALPDVRIAAAEIL